MDVAKSGAPGADLVRQRLEDLHARRETIEALLVSIGAPRLRELGLVVPSGPPDPEHRLYRLLAAESVDDAHARYNAVVRRLASFERARSCAN